MLGSSDCDSGSRLPPLDTAILVKSTCCRSTFVMARSADQACKSSSSPSWARRRACIFGDNSLSGTVDLEQGRTDCFSFAGEEAGSTIRKNQGLRPIRLVVAVWRRMTGDGLRSGRALSAYLRRPAGRIGGVGKTAMATLCRHRQIGCKHIASQSSVALLRRLSHV